MCPEMPIMSWVLLAPSSYKVEYVQVQSDIKSKWYIRIQDQASLEGTKELYEKVVKCQWFLLLLKCLLMPSIHL